MRTFSSSPYRLLRLARDHHDVRYPLAVLTILALIAIGVAGAHDWPAPSAEQPRLLAIELRAAPRADVRKAKPVRPAKKPSVRRALRRKSPSVRASRRRGAVASVGRGASLRPVPAARRDDRGAAPVRAPAPALAGEDEGDDRGGDDDGDGTDTDD
jgi:hypothetical protein